MIRSVGLPSGIGRRMDAVELAGPSPGHAVFGRLLEESGIHELGNVLPSGRVVHPDVVGEGGDGDRRIRIEDEGVDPEPGGVSKGSSLGPDGVAPPSVPFCRSAIRRHGITISGDRGADADAIGESLTCHIIIYIIHSK